jgi:hypothetical protein
MFSYSAHGGTRFREDIDSYGQISPRLNAGKMQGHGKKQSRYRRLFTTVENGRYSFLLSICVYLIKTLTKGAYQ